MHQILRVSLRIHQIEHLQKDIDEAYLARKLQRGVTYVSQRMMGKKPWAMDEAYAIMDLLRIPYDQMAAYFPPKGA